jgi:PAS domain S-box-containing protein
MFLEAVNSSELLLESKNEPQAVQENIGEGLDMFPESMDSSELLLESKKTCQNLLDNSFDAIITIDSEGIVRVWNQRAESMFGWKADEVIGKPLTETIIPPSFRKAHTKGLKNFIATKESRVLNQRLELTAIHRRGYEIPIELSIWASPWKGKPVFTAIIKDLTEIKNALKEMRLKEEEYKVLHEVAQALQDSASMKGMLQNAMKAISRSRELHVENKAGVFLVDEKKKILRLTSVLGEFPKGFLENQKEVPFYNIPYGRCYASAEALINNYCQFKPHRVGPFGHLTNYGSYIIPLKSRTKVVGVLFLYTPETPPCFEGSTEILLSIGSLMGNAIQHRKFERKIHQQNKKLNKLNDLKNKFLGIASHDLRSPLYAIMSYADILSGGSLGKLSDQQNTILNRMIKSGQHMCGLLEKLLDISQIESGQISIKKSLQNLNNIVKEQVDKNQLVAKEKNIDLHFSVGVAVHLKVDPCAIIQVVDNLIGNAIKFSPQNTKICVRTETLNNYFRFSVKDEGPGISREDQLLAFGEFQTLENKPTGGEKSTGLGLAISKKLIQLHGGKVGIVSQKGKGSTFYFDLPIQKADRNDDCSE